MSISKFIPSKTYQWKHQICGDINIWSAGNDTALIVKKIINYFNKKTYIEKDVFQNILVSVNQHFGIVIIAKSWTLIATDCIRSYPLFWKKTDKYFLISPQASEIAKYSPSIIDSDQRLAFQMSGYTIGDSTLWKNIKNINPGEYIFIDNKNKYTIEKYFIYNPWKSKNQNILSLKKKLSEEIKKIILRLIKKANGRNIIVPLSAGLDSRLIVSGLKEYKYKNVKCFTYGLKNNYESKASKIIAKKLGFEWIFVEINIKNSRKYFNSPEYKKFLEATNDGCATPGIQDVYAIKILLDNGYIEKNDLIINGNSGDFISGGHIPQEALKWTSKDDIDLIFEDISQIHLIKHYGLWDNLFTIKNLNIIKNILKDKLKNNKISFHNNNMPHGFLEFLEYENRQCKYVVNFQRVYDYYQLSWLLPLWDKSFINFWASVPPKYKIDQKLYKETLKELNLGQVWTDEFEYKYRLHSSWIRLIRFFFKIFFIFHGKDKWHQFDKKYFLYWTDNLCGQTLLSYKDIITNKNRARHFVSWHTLMSETINLKSNWQNIKF